MQLGGEWYAFDTGDGLMKKEQIVEYGGDVIRYQGADGKAVRNKTFNVANATFTADAGGNLVKASLHNVPLYQQRDLRWASRIVNGMAFGPTGCVPTTLASVVSATDGAMPLPIDLGYILGNADLMNGRTSGSGGSACVYIANRYRIPIEADLSIERARQILREGGVLSFAMNPGIFTAPGFTHEIFVMNYDKDKVFVHDPYGYAVDGWYSLETLFAQKSTAKGDCEAGGPVFGYSNKRIARSVF